MVVLIIVRRIGLTLWQLHETYNSQICFSHSDMFLPLPMGPRPAKRNERSGVVCRLRHFIRCIRVLLAGIEHLLADQSVGVSSILAPTVDRGWKRFSFLFSVVLFLCQLDVFSTPSPLYAYTDC